MTVLGIPNIPGDALATKGREALKRERLTEVEAGKWLEGAIPEAADFATELPLSAGSSRSQLSKQTTGFVLKPDDSAFCESRHGGSVCAR